MKKFFIADVLTGAKVIPAILLVFATVFNWSPFSALMLFAMGELLDALDGMAAKHWPHPEWTNELWFRKDIKLLESGLDMLLGIATLIYIIVRVDRSFGIFVLCCALIIGTIMELLLYGRLFGSEKHHKANSIMGRAPRMAGDLISVRFVVYLLALVIIGVRLFFAAISGWWTRVLVMFVAILIGIIILVKKYEDGRLDGVIETFKRRRL